MRRWRIMLALLAFAGAVIVYVDAVTGGDPDWFNWAQLLDPAGLHHEVLFVVFIAIGVAAVVA